MEKREVNKIIAEKLKQAKDIVDECRSLAKEHKVSLDVSGLLDQDEWSDIGYDKGWMPSSADC